MTSIPIYDATAPIACSAGDQYPARIEQIARLRDFGPAVDRTDHGLLVHFPNRPDVEADVQTLTVAEKGCCAFWGFDITTTDDRITLRWDGPPAVSDALDQVADFFESDAPVTALDGLF